jgi:hypothetical protein
MHCGIASAVPASYVSHISLALVAFVGCHGIGSDAPPHSLSHLASLPRLRLWAWERRQDLRSLDTKEFASAYLDQTLTIGLGVESQPGRDPFIFSASSTRIPVVRIEATRLSVLDDKNRAEAVRAILASAREPGIAAMQIEFDATRSQRQFYRNPHFEVRKQMPANLPLSITALAS